MLKNIVCDKRRIMQILLNFISNSLKFTPRKGHIRVRLDVLQQQSIDQIDQSQLEIDILTSEPMQKSCSIPAASIVDSRKEQNEETTKYIKLRMSIEDDGVGISKDSQLKLFTKFTRLKEHQAMNDTGTGLGLNICKKIIEQMGGSVGVESEEGQGTKFNIVLGLKTSDTKCSFAKIQSLESNQEFMQVFKPIASHLDFSRRRAVSLHPNSIQVPHENAELRFQFKTIKEQQDSAGLEDKFSDAINKLQMSISKQRTLPQRPKSSNISFQVASKDFLTPANKMRLNRFSKVAMSDNSSPSCASFKFSKPQQSMVTPKSSNHFCEEQAAISFDDQKTPKNVLDQYATKPRKLKVLVANDSSFQLLVAATSLRKVVWIEQVEEASNGIEALELVKGSLSAPFDLILLDLDMPIMDGFEACQKISQFCKLVNDELRISNQSQFKKTEQNERQKTFQTIAGYCDFIKDQPAIDEREFELLVNDFLDIVDGCRFKFLDDVKRPLIIAYSALVTKEVEKRCKDAGFDKCIEAPLNAERFNGAILPMLMALSDLFLKKQLSTEHLSVITSLEQQFSFE